MDLKESNFMKSNSLRSLKIQISHTPNLFLSNPLTLIIIYFVGLNFLTGKVSYNKRFRI